MNRLEDIGGSTLGVLAAFSILSIPVIGQIAVWQKVLALCILGTTLIVLWDKNYL